MERKMIDCFYNLIKILRGEKYYWDLSFLWGMTMFVYWIIALSVLLVILDGIGIIKIAQ